MHTTRSNNIGRLALPPLNKVSEHRDHGGQGQGSDYDPGCAGAGMTNAMWLQEGTPMLQLLPFGWNLTANRIHDGREPSPYKSQQVIRGHLYDRMAETANCSYHYWINDNARHAFFQG